LKLPETKIVEAKNEEESKGGRKTFKNNKRRLKRRKRNITKKLNKKI